MDELVEISTEELGYDLKDTYPNQLRVARLLAYGFTPPEIADHINVSERTVRRIAKKPGTEELIRNVAEIARRTCLKWQENFDFLMEKSIKTYEKVLTAPDDDEKVSMDLRFRAASAVMDRHPSSAFVKSSKQKIEGTIGLNDDTLEVLRRRALAKSAEVIDLPTSLHGCQPGEGGPPAPPPAIEVEDA